MAVNLPSISSTSGTLTAPGVGSGLDVNGLVSKLMAVEQQPLTLLSQKESDYQAKLSGLGTIKSAMSSLQTAASTLAAAGKTYTATVSDNTVLTATADGTALAGSSAISVSQLAYGQRILTTKPVVAEPWQSSTSASIGTGAATSISITLGTLDTGSASFAADPDKTPVSVAIDGTNNSLAGIASAINAANAGVTASIMNDGSSTPYHLVLTSTATGAKNTMAISVSGDASVAALLNYDPTAVSPTNFDLVQAAQDASLTVNGVTVTSASNTVTGAIQGVILNLQKAPTTSDISVNVQRASSSLTAALSALVNAYNSANTGIANATAKGATLQGDWAVLNLQSQVRGLFGSEQTAGGSYTTLSQLGISFQKDGSLAIDTTKLNAAISANQDDVIKLSTAIGTALNTVTTNVLGIFGPIANETASINNLIKDIGVRRTTLQTQLDATQARYQAQFNALDALLSSMNATSTFLTQQFNALSNSSSKG